MRGMVPPDPETGVSSLHFAIVYAANCVAIKDNLDETLAAADPENSYYAAMVVGPSKSSEGQYLYYLSEWL